MKIPNTVVPEERRLDEINRRTWERNDRIASFLRRAEAVQADNEKDLRESQQLCRYCFYIEDSRIGGAAVTTSNCSFCNSDLLFGSTCTDPLCRQCAKEHKLCVRCMGSMNGRKRRKL